MTVAELTEENTRLGNLPEYAMPEIVARRMAINAIIDRKVAEDVAELRRQEAAGERPPGQVVRMG